MDRAWVAAELAPLVTGVDGEDLGWAEGPLRPEGPVGPERVVAWLEGAAAAALEGAGVREAELVELTLELVGPAVPGRVRAEVVALSARRCEVEVTWRDGPATVARLRALYRR